MPESNPFNEDFCSYLEYHLTRTFANSEDIAINKLWCDGIAMPFIDSEISKKSVNETNCIITKAWIGYDGQQEHEMTIKFGLIALGNYNKDISLISSLPNTESTSWVKLDVNKRTIELQLN